MMNLETIAEQVEGILERARELVDVRTSFGDVRSLHGVDYVPVALVLRAGGLAGGGPDEEAETEEGDAGGGVGGGLAFSMPVGFLTEEGNRVVFNPILAPPWAYGTRAVDLLARLRRPPRVTTVTTEPVAEDAEADAD